MFETYVHLRHPHISLPFMYIKIKLTVKISDKTGQLNYHSLKCIYRRTIFSS